MATERDYYEILNVERTADGDTIKRAYRKMAMKYHPDRNPGDEEAERQFKEAAEAYEVLTDDQKRNRYNRFGHAGLRGQTGHNFHDMRAEDIFSMFGDIFGEAFGGSGGGRRGGRASRGYDLETQTEISLEEVASGVDRDIEFTRQDTCETCKGSGGKPGKEPVACVTCGGAGQVQQAGFGGMFRMVTTCPACHGAGKTHVEKCPDCRGSGRSPLKRKLSVSIPAGIHDGQAIRVAGEGEPGGAGASGGAGPRGDLHVVVRVRDHDLFARDRDDLVMKMPISFTQAALGDTVEVPALNGRAAEQTVSIRSGTQHGEILRIPGQGLPNLRGGRRGDLLVALLIEIPKKLTDNQEELLREFARTEDREVMPHSRGFWDKIRSYLS